MSGSIPVIAIDGPVGVGKGTISYRVAVHLGFHLLDSGAIYRLLALKAARSGVSVDDTSALCTLAAALDVQFVSGDAITPVSVRLDGEPVDNDIRVEACGRDASRLAALGPVRASLLERQRGFHRPPGLVADGRDMGTVVFPRATAKIFLTASPEERARRRHKQLIGKGIDVNVRALLGEINERDRRDRERSVAPLLPAEDAIVIDTTEHDVEAVFAQALAVIDARTEGESHRAR